ncbi:hypothetical protein [Pseudomonas zhanjiangensis]|uniref:DUF4870 domain-containing protein n=1 Tax=Pseudomonas zhanjiangensis TaxID=3239015 RepID=A0ABV3YZA1_9PSED
MNATMKDRNAAAATPLMVLAASYLIAPWLLLLLPPVLYFIYKKLSLNLSKDTTLKTFDLILSIVLISLAAGLIIGSLLIVARDGEFTIPLISSGLLTNILIAIFGFYLTWSLIKLSIMSFKGKAYKPKLSMGIFEALRGKRASNV